MDLEKLTLEYLVNYCTDANLITTNLLKLIA